MDPTPTVNSLMMPEDEQPRRRTWAVGALCLALAAALDARFNPVTVLGEVSGFSRAASGHCYFVLKDTQGQLRCALFRRAAQLVTFDLRDGDQVEVTGRLDVYGPRGELQLVAQSLRRAGQGALFERFLQIKERLAAEGLFDSSRKRAPVPLPRAIGVVTSLGAAAWHDVVTALRRRAAHVPVVLVPAAVQGASAVAKLMQALSRVYELAQAGAIDTILLVRGGGSNEDLWTFNDEALARLIARSPVPLISGVGHETDFTLADFCADVRAPTPTAAAELAAQPQQVWQAALQQRQQGLTGAVERRLGFEGQRADGAAARMGRPSRQMARQQVLLQGLQARLSRAAYAGWQTQQQRGRGLLERLARVGAGECTRQRQGLHEAQLRLELLDPQLILQRGYAWVCNERGESITQASQVQLGQTLRVTLAKGQIHATVAPPLAAQPDETA